MGFNTIEIELSTFSCGGADRVQLIQREPRARSTAAVYRQGDWITIYYCNFCKFKAHLLKAHQTKLINFEIWRASVQSFRFKQPINMLNKTYN